MELVTWERGLREMGTQERRHVVTRGPRDKGTRLRVKQTPEFCAKCVKYNSRSVHKGVINPELFTKGKITHLI